jgi:hypothetical protein
VDVKLAVVVAVVVAVVASVEVVDVVTRTVVGCCCLLLLLLCMAGAVGMKCSVEEEYEGGGEPAINENIFFKVKTTYKIQVMIMKHWLKNYLL